MIPRQLDNPKLYALVPAYNEASLIADFIEALHQKLSQYTDQHTIVVVDDGSKDDTANIVRQLAEQYPIHFISFSRNFGKESAITAGIEAADQADALVIIDADFQHPLEVIDQFIEKWQQGYDNVYGIRTRQDQGFLKSFLSSWFYKINKRIMRIELPANAGDFRLIDKQVIQAINCLPEANRFMKGLYAWVGFKGCAVDYTVQERADGGKSKWNYRKLFELAITGITAFSDIPLRFVSFAGFVISAIAILYGLVVVLDKLFFGINVPGYATLAAAIMFFGGIQLISIGVLGEYISRIFNEVKKRPTYIVDKRKSIKRDPH